MLKILISGAGIAGNALAFWLTKQGHDVTVIERFPNLRATGLQLDLRGHGVEVLRRMGLEAAFRAKAAPEQGMQVVDSSGRRRAYFPVNKSGSGTQSLTTEFEIMRGDLCRLLHDAAARANKTPPKYVYGTTVKSFEHKNNSVEVRFEDGNTDRFDLVVGADGQWSRTRRMMLGGAPDALHPVAGLYFTYFTMRRPMQDGEEYLATSYMAPGRRGIMTRRQSPHEIQVMLSCKTDSERLSAIPRGDVAAEKQAMAEVFKGAGWMTDDILQAMKGADDFYCERLGLVKLQPWSSGRVTLVGDAAYCPTVLSGMGTTCAMVGAYILAGEIGKHCRTHAAQPSSDGVTAALESYEQKFRPFMDQIQEGILEKAGSQWAMSGSAFSIGVMNLLVGVASFLKFNIADAFGIRESVKGWDLPGYEHMGRDKV